MEEKILLSLPGLYQFTNLNLATIDLMEQVPEKFNQDVVVDSMYGSFPCTWNGT